MVFEIILGILFAVGVFSVLVILWNEYLYEGVYNEKDVEGLKPGDIVKYIDTGRSRVKSGVVIVKGRYGCSVSSYNDFEKYENVPYKNIMWDKRK